MQQRFNPDEIRATEISPWINRLRPREIRATEISQGRRLTGQVGQAESAEKNNQKIGLRGRAVENW